MKNKVEIIKRAKAHYMKGESLGMCYSFKKTSGTAFEDIQLFNITIAINLFGANASMYWWPTSNRVIRIKYFNWLIKQYENEEENRI